MLSERETYLFLSIMTIIVTIVIPVCVKVFINWLRETNPPSNSISDTKEDRINTFFCDFKDGVYVLDGVLFMATISLPSTNPSLLPVITLRTLNNGRCLVSPVNAHIVSTIDRDAFKYVSLAKLMSADFKYVTGVTIKQLRSFKNSHYWNKVDRHKFNYSTNPSLVRMYLNAVKQVGETA